MGRCRKSFPCGHSGFGRYCHQCRQQQRARQAKAEYSRAWKERFHDDTIELRHLPQPIIKKTRKILRQIERGASAHEIGGRRMKRNRSVFSVAVDYRHRLVCLDDPEDGLVPIEALTHERYNKTYC